MGTTRDALLADAEMRLAFVLVIEGYDKLITSGDPAKAVTAWSGTLWSSALSGLQVTGNFSQRWRPFSEDLEVPSLTFTVIPDEDDTFGIAVFKSKPDAQTHITAPFSASHGTFDIDVQDSGQFSGTDPIHIGNRAYALDAVTPYPTATTIRVQANGAGYYAPFGTDPGSANRFPGQAELPSQDNTGSWRVTRPPQVVKGRRTFVGAKVGLWVHRIVNGVWDTKAQAEVLFAGKIRSVGEGKSGATVLQCEGLQAAIEEAIMLRNQWTAVPAEGMYFEDGMKYDLVVIGNNGVPGGAAALTCTTGASGTAEFEPGTYTAPEMCSIISDWLNNDGTVGGHEWAVAVSSDDNGIRTIIDLDGSSATTNYIFSFKANDERMLRFLGFDNIEKDDGYYRKLSATGRETTQLVSELPPMRMSPLGQKLQEAMGGYGTFKLEHVDGDFVDLTTSLPARAQEHVGSGETWSFFSLGDRFLFLAEKVSDTELGSIRAGEAGIGIPYPDDLAIFDDGVRMGAELPRIKQVAVLSGSFSDLLTKMLASTDGSGTNHATYDVLPWGAGIPWELLDTGWTDSIADVDQTTDPGYFCIIERPTSLWEVIKSDLALRTAFVVWKDGGLQLAVMQTPDASNPDWTLTEANKAVGPDQDSTTITEHTSEFLLNHLKVKYDRDPFSEKYTKTLIVSDVASHEDFGPSKPLSIKARNSYNPFSGTGLAVETLVDNLAARFMPPFARPLRRWKRSICHNLFLAAPGDTVAITDSFARNPTTGVRGTLAARGATVIGVSYSLGVSEGQPVYNGSIELLYTEEERTFPLSPVCKHRDYTGGTYTNGWSAGPPARLAVEDQEYGLASDSNDAAGFGNTDEVLVIEVDPADPTAADSFVDTLTAANAAATPNYLQLTNGFGVGGRPAFSSAKTYIVVPREYSACIASQLDTAFLGDRTDGLIEDLIDPNTWGEEMTKGVAGVDITTLPQRHADEWFQEGAALHPHIPKALAEMYNNLQNYGMVNDLPLVLRSDVVAKAPAGTWQVVYCFPYFLSRGLFFTGARRNLSVALQMRSTTGASVSVRVTSSAFPVRGANWDDPVFRGSTKSVTFSTTSTTFTTPAAQDLEIVRCETWPDLTFITVEMQGVTEIRGGIPQIFPSTAGN